MIELAEIIRNLPWGNIGFAGLVTLAIILIFKGEIVPKSTLESMRTDRDAIILAKDKENEMLKQAYRMSEEARLLALDGDKELLELGRTTVHLLESIHKQAKEVSG